MKQAADEGYNAFEQRIIGMMADDGLTMTEALRTAMETDRVDLDSVLDMTDYLEYKTGDLDRVSLYMDMLGGREPDKVLV